MTCALLLDMYFTAAELSRLRRRLADVVRMAGPGLTDEAIPAMLPDPDSDFGEDGRGLWLARELSDRLHITGGSGGAIVTLEFELLVTTHRDTPGLASAAAPGGSATR